jgi:hypothetical protein
VNKYNILEQKKNMARMGKKRNLYGVLVGTPEVKTAPGRPREEDNIKTDLQETCVNWIDLNRDMDYVPCSQIVSK